MLTALANHLWQSTVFAAAAFLLTLALRRNPARVRHAVWLAASVKFLVPFSLLIWAGSRFEWHAVAPIAAPGIPLAMEQISQPFTLDVRPAAAHGSVWPMVLMCLWLAGCAVILVRWLVRWYAIRAALRTAIPLRHENGIQIVSSGESLEPGVFGIFRPVLVLPEGIAAQLSPEQLTAVLAHEMCHVRRHDNLAAAIHMLIEALFWFHPLVWWIGARLLEERERACDEAVLQQGSQAQTYAEGILRVCQFYVASPVACVSGVTGADLKRRIEEIMTHRIAGRLSFGRKLLLAAAGVAAVVGPFAAGFQSAFEVASVHLVPRGLRAENLASIQPGPGTITLRQQTLKASIRWAYALHDQDEISGPDWINNEEFDIIGKAPGKATVEQLRVMLQALLAERFKLAFHRKTEERPVYALVVAKTGSKLHQVEQPPLNGAHINFANGVFSMGIVNTVTEFAAKLPMFLDRPVLDKTGLTGVYEITVRVELTPESRPLPAAGQVFTGFGYTPSVFGAVQELGLKLESQKGPVAIFVIDRAERPTEN